jgi:KinB signaling pathway activation protein
VNLRKYGWLFMTTLLVGGIGGILSGFLIGRAEMFGGSISNLLMGSLMNLLFGLTISIVAQMGLFAYMTINYMALGVLKSGSLWKSVQAFLVLFTFFDMVYLRYGSYARGTSIWPYLIEPIALLCVALITAYAKVKLTNSSAWIPTTFFIFVVTAVEWIPALRQENPSSILFMVVPLLFCNIWQVMQLHRLTQKES